MLLIICVLFVFNSATYFASFLEMLTVIVKIVKKTQLVKNILRTRNITDKEKKYLCFNIKTEGCLIAFKSGDLSQTQAGNLPVP